MICSQSKHGLVRIAIVALLVPCAWAADANPARLAPNQSDLVYTGWLAMYDQRFDDAHQVFARWRQPHPSDPFGYVSDAAAYLFSELARMGVLESELFTNDSSFFSVRKISADPAAKRLFLQQIDQADRLTAAVLQKNPLDASGLFAKSISLGLRADYAGLLDRQYLAALSYTKEARVAAEKVLSVDPQAFDVNVGLGVEHYVLSLKSAPVRLLMRMTGARIDAEKGLQEVHQAAAHGHYLEPFAKMLLAVAALRDQRTQDAKSILTELHNRFPHNDMYLRELNRLSTH
jgi:hypothetical protein